MPAEPQASRPDVMITTVNQQLVEVTLTGDVSTHALRALEERFDDPRLQGAAHWVLDVRGVTRMELACAYALLRAVTLHSGTTTVRGARRAVLRTLQQAGLNSAAVIEE
ncbi:STAS domain-containing protein [Streptomyces sp. NPDC014776]|uniref:STAS domain-containing protein n=1 Tax=unclassified Streptomyces TaxID=2593676 RepID=UPI0036F51C8A